MAINIKLGQLEQTLRRDIKARREAVKNGISSASLRGRALLTSRTPTGATNLLKVAWQVRKAQSGYLIENTAPYAGVIEGGARPHPVSLEGRLAIQHWAMRKLGMDEKEAAGLADGVAHKLAEYGQQGTFYVKNSLPELAKFLDAEITRYLTTAVK